MEDSPCITLGAIASLENGLLHTVLSKINTVKLKQTHECYNELIKTVR